MAATCTAIGAAAPGTTVWAADTPTVPAGYGIKATGFGFASDAPAVRIKDARHVWRALLSGPPPKFCERGSIARDAFSLATDPYPFAVMAMPADVMSVLTRSAPIPMQCLPCPPGTIP